MLTFYLRMKIQSYYLYWKEENGSAQGLMVGCLVTSTEQSGGKLVKTPCCRLYQ